MVLGIFKKLFSSGTPAESSPRPARQAAAGDAGEQEPDVEAFVAYVAKALVDAPEKVAVQCDDSGSERVVKVACEKADVGKLIGKKGKTVAAIRALANGAGRRGGKRINVEILD